MYLFEVYQLKLPLQNVDLNGNYCSVLSIEVVWLRDLLNRSIYVTEYLLRGAIEHGTIGVLMVRASYSH